MGNFISNIFSDNSILKIIITNDYKLQVKYINSEYKETIIHLSKNNQSNVYTPSITFNENLIDICEETDSNIDFMKEWILNPEEYKLYSIKYQGKEYNILAEVLFALIISEFKQIVEKDNIIQNTLLQLPTNNEQLLQRVKIALQALELNGIEIREDEEIPFDYSEQGEYFNELLEKKSSIEKQKRMIERAKKINPDSKEKLDEINLNKQDMNNEEAFNHELAMKFNTKERTEMKLCQLDNYCIFIASKYLETIDDHINLIKVAKKLQYNMEKFHFNPISLDETNAELFPNVETLHLYTKEDKYLEGRRIQKYINWNIISYQEYKENKDENKTKDIDFKHVVWTENDNLNEVNKLEWVENLTLNSYELNDMEIKITIPEGVNEIEENCFKHFLLCIKELTILPSIKSFPHYSLEKFQNLKKIIIKDEKIELIGNRLFYHDEYTLYSISLPKSVESVNNQQIKPLINFTIPSNVIRLSDYCFENCEELTEIKGLEHVKEFGHGCFYYCPKLDKDKYPQIQKNIKEYLNEFIREEQQKQLEKWTSLKCWDILFDSNIDDYSKESSLLNSRIIGKSKLAFVIEDEDGEIFGYYLNTEIIEKYNWRQRTDSKTFHFNLQSQYNRLPKPMKFDLKHLNYGGIQLNNEHVSDVLIILGDISLKKNIYRFESFCFQSDKVFNYHEIKNALCGKTKIAGEGNGFMMKRFIVIQMK